MNEGRQAQGEIEFRARQVVDAVTARCGGRFCPDPRTVILIGGQMCSGKTTLAGAVTNEMLSRGYPVFRTSFAAVMKRAYRYDSSVNAELLELLVEAGVFPYWAANYTNEQDKLLCTIRSARAAWTQREFYQYFGTEVIRKHDPDFFARKVALEVDGLGSEWKGAVVVDDWRFPNEAETLWNLGLDVFTVLLSVSDAAREARGCDPRHFNHSSEHQLENVSPNILFEE